MNAAALKRQWLLEQDAAHIHGWDFSHIRGRYSEEEDLPWDYGRVVRRYLTPSCRLLDYDTGGGEFLLRLGHPHALTAATEGYAPNVALCRERLTPLGVDFRPCADPARIPFPDSSFDLVINRHGDMNPEEFYRLLVPGGVFVTEQVGADNDRDLAAMVLPPFPPPFPQQTLACQTAAFTRAGFTILEAQEACRPITFYDIGAFVWFARIIEWEFPGFSVERCFDRLLAMQRLLEQDGRVTSTIHRFLIVAKK